MSDNINIGKTGNGGNHVGGGCMMVFGLLFAGMGLLFLVLMSKQAINEAQTYLWEQAPCEVVSCEIKVQQGREGGAFQLLLEYQYQVNGESFTSQSYTLQEHWSDDYEKLALKRKSFLADPSQICYVDPDDASSAVIKREGGATTMMLLLPIIFIVVGGLIVWGGFLSLRKKKAQRDGLTQSISKRGGSSSTAGWKFKLVFGGLFALVGGGIAIPFALTPTVKMMESRSWQETPCKILWSRVQRHESTSDGKTSITYSVDIFYEYQFEGVIHRSNQFGIFDVSSSGRAAKKALARQYPRGSQQICYVDIKVPERALMRRGFSWGLLFGLIPVVFLLIGLAVLRSGLKSRSALAGNRGGRDSLRGGSFADAYRRDSEEAVTTRTKSRSSVFNAGVSNEARVLSPGKKRLGGALAILVFALFWNGIVSIFLWEVVEGFQKGRAEWFMLVFLIPFVLIGLLVILVFLYQLLALSNPKPVLTVNPGVLHAGQNFEISWKIASNVARIKHFKIELWGVESATYQRGTKSHTSREVFYVHALVESSMHSEIRSGLVKFDLPADLVPSLNTGNSAIEWELRVTGDIPRWPDIQDNYKIEMKG